MSTRDSKSGQKTGPAASRKASDGSETLATPPVRTGGVTPFQTLEDSAMRIQANALKSTNPVAAQEDAKLLDSLLRDCATLQQRLGQIRKTVGSHIAMLRQANPKGPPEEGTVKQLSSGKSVIFIGGSWQPFIQGDRPPTKEESSPKG